MEILLFDIWERDGTERLILGNIILDSEMQHQSLCYYKDYAPFWPGNENLNKDFASVFSRPYPLATAGLPQKLIYDFDSREFHYKYIIKSGSNGNYPTEIFIPPMIYIGKSNF